METDNPITRFNSDLARAEAAGLLLHNGMALATVNKSGKPSVRIMLLKGADKSGFVFYTNFKSRKAEELLTNPAAALCFWWPTLEEQIRIEGNVTPVTDQEADAYFATRPRGSQTGAWASEQSAPLSSRDVLVAKVKEVETRYAGKDVVRPPFWSGFRLTPEVIEFWFGKPDRLHERICYTRTATTWTKTLLYP